MYRVQYGCDEWQDEHQCETLESAIDYIKNEMPQSMGLYPVDFFYVEDEDHNIVLTESEM